MSGSPGNESSALESMPLSEQTFAEVADGLSCSAADLEGAERLSAEASASVRPESALANQSEERYEEFLKGVAEDLASQSISDMQWEMIQDMLQRKKGNKVSAIAWLFTFFTRGQAYFWLEFLEEHLLPELTQCSWPDRYGGGFVFSSAGWTNAAPLQAAKRPAKPKAKRDRNKAGQQAQSIEPGTMENGLGMNIRSYRRKEDTSVSEANGVVSGHGGNSKMVGGESRDAFLLSAFGTPNHISSQSPSRTGGFNTNATRPSSVPMPLSAAKATNTNEATCKARTSRSSSRASGRSTSYSGHSQQQESRGGAYPNRTDNGDDLYLATARRAYDEERLSLRSAPCLPRSLERRMSPNHPFRPKGKAGQGDWNPRRLNFTDSLDGRTTFSRSLSSLEFLQSQYRSSEGKGKKGEREKLYKTVNSLSELQLNFTRDLIKGCLRDEEYL